MPKTEKDLLLEVINKHLIEIEQKSESYTRIYYYWKKYRNIFCLFKNELKVRKGLIKVIDIGCGLGKHTFYLNRDFGKKQNLEFYGIDLDPSKIYCCNLKKEKYRAKNITFGVDNAECLSFPDNSFDIILSIEVLEHLKRPKRAINEFYRILKPQGLAIITTPNQSTLVTKLKMKLKPILEKLEKGHCTVSKENGNLSFDTLDVDHEKAGYGHISVHGLKEWIRFFSESNFTIEKIGRGSLLGGTPQQDKRRAIVAFALLMEILLDKSPWLKNLSEDVIISARKIASNPQS